ncbi:Histone-lysine N-methyltransferase [Nesidiocoris tenuis]|uniref:Histone-lysine N-methyltransferase n=1 Tax=Nesidiocoris tenuis TaxID=355587 RepID=A0ABN7AYV7_9HEMI|nr:Histone-lysine N-methyltransferase [Nesidiocoris tenuis]
MASSSEGTSSPSEAGEPDEDQKEHSSPSHLALALIPEDASISRIGVEEVTVTGDISPNPVNVIFLDSSPIYRRPLKNQEIVLAHRRDKGYWCRAAILRKTYCSNQMTKEITTKHQVHYEDGVRPVEPLSLDEIAYSEVCRKLIPVGTPVVTDISDTCIKFTPGVIIETPTFLNRNRYAVMSPKGTARYVEHSDIRIVAGTNFSFDSDQFDPDFLLDHMEIYPNYVTVRMKPGGNAIFNRNKEWTSGKVISIDCSIVQILFDDGDVESYHRGSYRNHRLIFEPLADAISKMGVPRLKRLRSSVNRRVRIT